MDSANFYSNLTPFADFAEVTNREKFRALPEDWLIVIADISNSTDAVSKGALKAVNIVGVAVITAIRNLATPIEIPYMFGGDGANLCIPPRIRDKTQQALVATRHLAQQRFGLNLRIGLVSVQEIRAAKYDVRVAKHRLSEFYFQAAFAGGGMEYAETMLKKVGIEQLGMVDNIPPHEADYDGLECRWDQVPSKHGETIALIVKAIGDSPAQTGKIYDLVIQQLASIYGQDEKCRPVHAGGLRLSFNSQKLSHEIRIRNTDLSPDNQRKHLYRLRGKNLLGWFLMLFRLRTGEIRWGRYQRDLISNTDFKKFDGTLRQVISGTPGQRHQLVSFLQGLYQQGKCVFGIHVSDAALITCMIDSRAGEHYHFVDSVGGGYTSAAEAMKRQLEARSAIAITTRSEATTP